MLTGLDQVRRHLDDNHARRSSSSASPSTPRPRSTSHGRSGFRTPLGVIMVRRRLDTSVLAEALGDGVPEVVTDQGALRPC